MTRLRAISLMILGVLIAAFGVFYLGLALFEGVRLEAWLQVGAWLALVGGIGLLSFGIYSSPPLPGGANGRQLPLWYERTNLVLALGIPIGSVTLLVLGPGVSIKTIAWRTFMILVVCSGLIRSITQIIPPQRSGAIADGLFWAAIGALLVLLASPFAT